LNNDNASSSWLNALNLLTAQGDRHVMITLIGSTGSTPRDIGTKMVVSEDSIYGSIGGGQLEYKCLDIAAAMLSAGSEEQRIEHFPLAASLGQCCGGSNTVLFESFNPRKLTIALFGAGHVGKSVCGILQQLPCQILWVDCRENLHPKELPSNVTGLVSDGPAEEVASLPAGSHYLIMTHSHQLDFEILEAILRRDDARYVGLIGSRTKWRRFQRRLEHRGYSPDVYRRVDCPAGLSEVPGKLPVEVAVSIAGRVIAEYQATSGEQAPITAREDVETQVTSKLICGQRGKRTYAGDLGDD
jgi:xanthine dehydrogenase accessory factor